MWEVGFVKDKGFAPKPYKAYIKLTLEGFSEIQQYEVL